MRKSLAIKVAKITRSLGNLAGKSGTALPGLVAEKIDPCLLAKLANNNFPKGIIIVTGTNGKTTTCKMLANILDANDVSYIRNTAGSNLRRGVIATVLAHCDFSGKCNAEMAIFEVDEAYVPTVTQDL